MFVRDEEVNFFLTHICAPKIVVKPSPKADVVFRPQIKPNVAFIHHVQNPFLAVFSPFLFGLRVGAL